MATRWMVACVTATVWLAGGCGDDGDGNGNGGGAGGAGQGGLGGSGGATAGAPAGGATAGGSGGASAGGMGGLPGPTGGTGGQAAGGTGGTSAAACTSLNLTGQQPMAVISEVIVGVGVELYNPGTAPVPLNNLYLCANFSYTLSLDNLSTETQIPPGGYVTVDWHDDPATGWPAVEISEASGEMLLYDGNPFPSDTNRVDYVCWGSFTGGRLDESIELGTYSGACTPAIPSGGSLQRLAASPGQTAASFQTSPTPSPLTCAP